MYTVSVTNNTIQLEKMITQRERLKIEINNIYIRINEFSIEEDHTFVDRASSRGTTVTCFCCCDGADDAATELMLRAARVPPRGAAASLLEVLPAAPRGGTRR